ncbi:MAG: sigma-70 family RNA polymerase sigma factor [Deltaproteobacteria bacterium]|nr:sigma-70 family RNA polymerase sigma factor [Deltaproteobacteria bacterium]
MPRSLVVAFIDALPPEQRTAWSDHQALDTSLADAVAAAQAAHPGIRTDANAFAGRIAQAVGADRARLGVLPIPDLYLAFGCAMGDRVAADTFIRLHGGQIDRVLAKAERGLDVAERRQAALTHILAPRAGGPAKIDGYRGRGSLDSWIRVVVARLAVDLFRRRGAEVEVAVDPMLLQEVQPDGQPDRESRRHEADVTGALEDALERLDADERRLLRERFAQGRTTDELATARGVHRTTIARRVDQVRAKLATLAREALRQRLRVDEATATSLLAMVPDGLDVSVNRLLASRAEPQP